MNNPTFDDLWNAVCLWAEHQAAHIAANGSALTESQLAPARKVGVVHPEKIRVLAVPDVPFPEDPSLRAIAAHVGLIPEQTAGMTLGHGIFLRGDEMDRPKLWAHEFRHVRSMNASVPLRPSCFSVCGSFCISDTSAARSKSTPAQPRSMPKFSIAPLLPQ